MNLSALAFSAVLTLGALSVRNSTAAELRLDIKQGASTNVAARLSTQPAAGTVLTLEASTNLVQWQSIGTTHDALLEFPDFTSAGTRYYRAWSAPRFPTNDWKNQILHPDDPFLSWAPQQPLAWIKFAILLEDPTRVYYQPGSAYPFHYDFAVARLPGFSGIARSAFDLVSLYRTNQQVVLGAVLVPTSGVSAEFGIQFVGLEPYSPEEVARWFSLVKETVFNTNRAGVYYIPVYEQSDVARTNRAAFEDLGVQVASLERWIDANHVYASGWAVGRLKFFPAAEISAAFADGRLTPRDVLLTDGVPAETPPVAGIISLRPSTPNSHTAILSRSFGIPFVYLPEPHDQARVQALTGRKVLLRANATYFGAVEVSVFDLEETLDPVAEAQLQILKQPPELKYAPKQTYGSISAATDSLAPNDIQFFGGKAANYGFLRRAVATNSPPAIALSFDVWDAFMGQTAPGGARTLRDEISARLLPFANYPPQVAELKAVLADIRTLIRSAAFTGEQEEAITNVLQVFDGSRKIRFRSSTNIEDAEHFTGAGLYDSYSGCLMDDLDGDTSGPSACDPSENQERGVFRAIKRVYASFYNDNAFLERLRYGIDESTVGMAVLVHHSFPDEDELANGVATLNFRSAGAWEQISGEMVSQKGAVSVTNPDGNSLPEVITWERFLGNTYLNLKSYSSLLPLGAHVLTWEGEYKAFSELFLAVTAAFRKYYPEKTRFTLDFEFKKDRRLGLVVKQVREVPEPAGDAATLAFLIDTPTTLVVAQKEAADVFSNHRLKSQWNLQSRNMWLVSSNLAEGIYTQGHVEYLQDASIAQLSGPLAEWPSASLSSDGLTNTWTTGSGLGERHWTLHTDVATIVDPGAAPVLTQGDFSRFLHVTYQQPQPVIDYQGYTTTTNATVVLEPVMMVDSGSILVERSFSTNGVTIETSFYWPKEPSGVSAGYTAPLVRFQETRITDLTAAPIILTNYYSQTYRPGHHNFSEEFIFEPRLDPAVSVEAKAALESANVQLLYLHIGGPSYGRVLGLDGKFRPL
jgi:hypothetical protein